jgi:phospholipid/cholesterol/gamma-HCH transport system ATP-binding protein
MAIDRPQTSGLLVSVRNLRKSFNGQVVLHGVNFEVRAGEVFVIMGPSGSGKTVLLKHIIGLESPDSGEIEINGEPVRDDEARARFRLAMVFQSGGLLSSLTVAENVGLYLTEHRLKPPGEVDTIVREKLELVQLAPDVAVKFPNELSGGMRKRVAIARALVMEPQMILYDEPTGELDPVVAMAIGQEILRSSRRTGATSIVVTHDRDLAFGIADRIAFLAGGKILALGTPDEIKGSQQPELHRFLAAEFRGVDEVESVSGGTS